jgi:hypothetical protein
MTTLVFNEREWTKIRKKISAEHGPTFLLISSRVTKELGFTIRRHYEWHDTPDSIPSRYYDYRLDFKDEITATWFRLKYF